MVEVSDILISLEQRHAENIFSGKKKVELRRRKMRIMPGTKIFIYVKVPVASIVGYVTVAKVFISTPKEVWKRYGAVCGLKHQEFFNYFRRSSVAFVLILNKVRQFRKILSLSAIKRITEDFRPPQFFTRLQIKHPLLFRAIVRKAEYSALV